MREVDLGDKEGPSIGCEEFVGAGPDDHGQLANSEGGSDLVRGNVFGGTCPVLGMCQGGSFGSCADLAPHSCSITLAVCSGRVRQGLVDVRWGGCAKHENVGGTPYAACISGVDGQLQLPEHHFKSMGRQGHQAACSQLFYGPVQPLHLPITVGGVWAGPHLCHSQCLTQPLELTFEFSPIVSSHPGRHPKCLEHLLLGALGHSGAAFVSNWCDHHKLAETADSNKQVQLPGSCPQIDHQVQTPLTPGPRGKGEKLPLPAPMCLTRGKLTLKASRGERCTVSTHGGPPGHVLEQLIHFLAPNVVVLHMQLLHDEQLLPHRRKMHPLLVNPLVQLT